MHVATMNEEDSSSVASQKLCLFDGSVASADDDQTLVAKGRKRAVASSASRNAVAAKPCGHFRFARNPKPLGACSRRDNQCLRFYKMSFARVEFERPLAQINRLNIGLKDFRPET